MFVFPISLHCVGNIDKFLTPNQVTFAYARDGCFPLSKYWKRVNRHTQTPVNAVWFNNVIGNALLLLIFGGELAIGAIFSIGACAAFVAFTTPIFIRVFFVGNRFRPGPWNLGRWSIPIGAVASGFVALMVPLLCFPSVKGKDLTNSTMNWTVVVYGGPMVNIPPTLEILLTRSTNLLTAFSLTKISSAPLSGGSSMRTSGLKARKSISSTSCTAATNKRLSWLGIRLW